MLNISFNFDEVTQKVSNLKVTSLSKVNLDEGEPLVQLMDNKLKLTPKTVEMIGAKVGDRIQVNYWTENNHNTFPLIGRSEVFTDKEEGCKLTGSNTVSFRGNKNSTLKIYGNLFKLEPFKENMFKLVKVEEENDSMENEQKELEDLNTSEIDDEINDIMSQAEDNDDLPF